MLKLLEQIDDDHKVHFGAKASYLAQLISAGFKVPSGFAVTLSHDFALQKALIEAELATFSKVSSFAIRSSACDEDGAAFSKAGQYESFLGVSNVLPLIERVFASPFAGSVIVQEMIESDFGGVCFTKAFDNPEALVIELCLGRNTGVTQGQGQVARLTMRRTDGSVVSVDDPADLLSKGPLWEKENPPTPFSKGGQIQLVQLLQEVANISLRIERALGFAVDVEWCVRDAEIFILQSRPITGLKTSKQIEAIQKRELDKLCNDAKLSHFAFWTDFSIGDMFRHPSQLFLDLVNFDRGAKWSARRVYQDLGLKPAAHLPGPLFVSICDRAYINVAHYLRFLFPNFALAPLLLLFKLPFKFSQVRREFHKRYDSQALAQLKEEANALASVNYDGLSDDALFERFDFVMARLSDEAIYAHLMSDVVAGLSQGLLRACLNALFNKNSSDWEFRLTTGLYGNFNSETTLALQELSEGTIDLATFLQDFGHRGNPDWDLASPRWREDPSKVERMAKNTRDFKQQFLTQIRIRQEAQKELSQHLSARAYRRFFAQFIERQLRYVHTYSPLREQTQSVVFAFVEATRCVILAIAKRRGFGEAIFGLSHAEFLTLRRGVNQEESERLKRAVAARKDSAVLARRIYLPHQFAKKDLAPALFEPPQIGAASMLRGTKVSGGICVGIARVINELSELSTFDSTDIIITQFADPSYASQLLCAGGLVLEQGSTYSHMAIIAREFGLPALVNVENATKRVVDGQRVRLDANKGELLICEPPG